MKVGEDLDKLPAAEFLQENGLLFEINRKILHPFGIALYVVENEDDDGNKTVALGDLQDYRDDPEGMIFGEKTFREGMGKLTKFMNEVGYQKLTTRHEHLGYVIQHAEQELIQSPDVPSPSLKTKMIKRVGTAPGTIVDVNEFAKVSGQADDDAEDAYLNSAASAADTPEVSVEDKMVQKAKEQLRKGKGIVSTAHMKADGTPCNNPVIVDEKIKSGGVIVFCSSCGTQLKDPDSV